MDDVPVEVGSTKQLFLDDRVVGDLENVTRTFHSNSPVAMIYGTASTNSLALVILRWARRWKNSRKSLPVLSEPNLRLE